MKNESVWYRKNEHNLTVECISHPTNPAIVVGALEIYGSNSEKVTTQNWFFSINNQEGEPAYSSAEDAMLAAEKEFFSRNESTIRNFLIIEVYALKQRLKCQLSPVAAPDNNDALGDWIVEGVFQTNEPYHGPLSGLGLSLTCSGDYDGAPLSYRFKALPGYRPLMDEAYEALDYLKKDKREGEVSLCQPWTRWIINALKDDSEIVSLGSANDSWLELVFSHLVGEAVILSESHYFNNTEVSLLDMNGGVECPEHVEMWVEDISKQIRLAIKGQITAKIYPYRFQYNEFLAFDLEGAVGEFSFTFMAGMPYDLNDITPWVPDMSEALALAGAICLRLDALVKFHPGLRIDNETT